MNAILETADAPSTKAIQEFQSAERRIRNANSAWRLWERHLTPEERERLGGDFEQAYKAGGTAQIWANLHGGTLQRAVVDVAHLIGFLRDADHKWLLREMREHLDGDEAYERAIVTSQLVLNEYSREVFWRGEPIPIDWNHEALWSFMWELARQAKVRRSIDSLTFGERAQPNVVAKRKYRLTSQEGFPVAMSDLIEPVGRGTQQLKLPPEEIRIFEQFVDGEIREWRP